MSEARKPDPKGKGCWYFTYRSDCPLCGVWQTTRERRWGRKPKDPAKRYSYREYACWDHWI